MTDTRLLVIDAGTTGIRALIFDEGLAVVGTSYTEFTQYHPGTDRVEQDATEIWETALDMCRKAMAKAGIEPNQITAIGITNQRATTVVWDRETGDPITRAIVWQDTRTAAKVDELEAEWGEKVYSHTGWALAPVYSSLSLNWILTNVEGARELAAAGRLAFGTVDTWLIHRLSGRKAHVIPASNASVTGSYDLIGDRWYTEWLDALDIPVSMFPEVVPDSGEMAVTDPAVFGAAVPITSAVADQHSALFAQKCIEPGMVKCTHGTGTFLDMNIGGKPVIDPKSGVTTLIAWRIGNETTYGLEGYAAVTGAAVQWLRDGARMIGDAGETAELATSVPDNGGVYFVPALTGLSAPYWDSYARGLIVGISPGTTKAHIIRAALEGIVHSVGDFTDTMAEISGHQITTIATDGGASRNDVLMQFQADLLNAEVTRPQNTEATAVGAALLAGLAVGVWATPEEAFEHIVTDAVFTPQMDDAVRQEQRARWSKAVSRAQGWAR